MVSLDSAAYKYNLMKQGKNDRNTAGNVRRHDRWTMLQEEGVEYVRRSGITSVPLHALNQMPRFKFIHAAHEDVAVGMADGLARHRQLGVVWCIPWPAPPTPWQFAQRACRGSAYGHRRTDGSCPWSSVIWTWISGP
jgi:hypothetical protein